MLKTQLTLWLFIILFPSMASAHFLWLDESCGADTKECEARLYFGEYHQNKIEKLDGRLAERKGTRVYFRKSGGEPQELRKKEMPDHFRLSLPDKGGELLAVDDKSAVVDWRKYRIGVVRPVFYARSYAGGLQKSAPFHVLDIVPAEAGNPSLDREVKLQLYFNSKPYTGRADIKIYSPKGWLWEGELGSDGIFSFTPQWPGLYVADVIVMEESPGSFNGKDYEAVRHRATLSIEVPG